MKINELTENNEPITPSVKWKTNGDGSHTVRIEYTPEKVFVHTSKNLDALRKLVKDKYGPKTFV